MNYCSLAHNKSQATPLQAILSFIYFQLTKSYSVSPLKMTSEDAIPMVAASHRDDYQSFSQTTSTSQTHHPVIFRSNSCQSFSQTTSTSQAHSPVAFSAQILVPRPASN